MPIPSSQPGPGEKFIPGDVTHDGLEKQLPKKEEILSVFGKSPSEEPMAQPPSEVNLPKYLVPELPAVVDMTNVEDVPNPADSVEAKEPLTDKANKIEDEANEGFSSHGVNTIAP